MLSTIYNFIVYSSADPEKISLTIRSAAFVIIPVLMAYFGWDESTAGEFISDVTTLTVMAFTLFGFARKIILTYLGENRALW